MTDKLGASGLREGLHSALSSTLFRKIKSLWRLNLECYWNSRRARQDIVFSLDLRVGVAANCET